MHSAPGEEGRFELALSTSLLNELKYGSQLGKLAEALLLSAFSDSSIKPSLQQEIAAALPSVRYIRWQFLLRFVLLFAYYLLLTKFLMHTAWQPSWTEALSSGAATLRCKEMFLFVLKPWAIQRHG